MPKEHTPTPWYMGFSGNDWLILDNCITADSEGQIASLSRRPRAEADAALIVKAVNAYGPLLAACEQAEHSLRQEAICPEDLNALRAAIALAKKETGP